MLVHAINVWHGIFGQHINMKTLGRCLHQWFLFTKCFHLFRWCGINMVCIHWRSSSTTRQVQEHAACASLTPWSSYRPRYGKFCAYLCITWPHRHILLDLHRYSRLFRRSFLLKSEKYCNLKQNKEHYGIRSMSDSKAEEIWKSRWHFEIWDLRMALLVLLIPEQSTASISHRWMCWALLPFVRLSFLCQNQWRLWTLLNVCWASSCVTLHTFARPHRKWYSSLADQPDHICWFCRKWSTEMQIQDMCGASCLEGEMAERHPGSLGAQRLSCSTCTSDTSVFLAKTWASVCNRTLLTRFWRYVQIHSISEHSRWIARHSIVTTGGRVCQSRCERAVARVSAWVWKHSTEATKFDPPAE